MDRAELISAATSPLLFFHWKEQQQSNKTASTNCTCLQTFSPVCETAPGLPHSTDTEFTYIYVNSLSVVNEESWKRIKNHLKYVFLRYMIANKRDAFTCQGEYKIPVVAQPLVSELRYNWSVFVSVFWCYENTASHQWTAKENSFWRLYTLVVDVHRESSGSQFIHLSGADGSTPNCISHFAAFQTSF